MISKQKGIEILKLNINKLADEVIASLKEEKSGSKTVWDELTSQVSQDGTWDQELIDKIEKYAHLKLKPHKENDVRALWESTEAAMDSFEDSDEIEIEKAKADIVEDIVNKVLDKADTSYEDEEYYNEFDEDEDEMEDFGFKFDDEKDDF